MEEQIKIIEIPNFLKVKIVKINEKYCAYYVEDYSNEYFYRTEDDFLKTHTIASMPYLLSVDIPFTIIVNIENLEEAIYKLHKELTKDQLKELTKDKIPRAKRKEKYYIITIEFKVVAVTELNSYADRDQYNSYNYFTSKVEAEKYAKILQETLVKLRKEEYIKGE